MAKSGAKLLRRCTQMRGKHGTHLRAPLPRSTAVARYHQQSTRGEGGVAHRNARRIVTRTRLILPLRKAHLLCLAAGALAHGGEGGALSVSAARGGSHLPHIDMSVAWLRRVKQQY